MIAMVITNLMEFSVSVYEFRKDLIRVNDTIENRKDIKFESTVTQASA